MIFGEGPIIKNIAGDLNKLFLQGTRAGQPINNVEGDAVADQATVQLMADRDPVIRDISTGLGWAGREVTVSGTGALQLVNSLGRPLKSWSVELSPCQEGSGDPSPENVRPIYGTDRITIWTSGSNVCNKANTINAYLDGSGTLYYNNDMTSVYVELIPDVQYTVKQSVVSAWSNRIAFVDSLTDRVNCYRVTDYGRGINAFDSQYTQTFTNRRYKYLIITFYRASVDGDNYDSIADSIQLNFGSTALPYEPYNGSKTVITLPQTVYTGSVSSDGGESGWDEMDLGTLTWETYSLGVNCFCARLPNGITTGTNYSGGVMCEIYSKADYITALRDTDGTIGVGYANLSTITSYVAIHDSRFTSVEAVQTAMQGVKMVYELAAPTEFAIITPDIPTSDGDISAWVTAEDGIVTNFSVTYLQNE